MTLDIDLAIEDINRQQDLYNSFLRSAECQKAVTDIISRIEELHAWIKDKTRLRTDFFDLFDGIEDENLSGALVEMRQLVFWENAT